MLQTQSVEKSLWNLLKDLQGKEMKLKDMFEFYKQKFNQSDMNPIKRSLVYFDDVTESNWLSVKLLKGALSIDILKQTLIEKMNEYNKRIIEKT